MKFVQLLLTDEQSELTAAALRDAEAALKQDAESIAAADEEGADGESTEAYDDAAQVGRLAMLFQDASENPAKYTPTGEMAATVRTIVKRAKGRPAIPSLRKKRSGRHQRRRAERHLFRRNREYIAQYNAATERYEQDRVEAEAAAEEMAARTADQPKYTVTDGHGNVLMTGIPAEFIRYEDTGESLYKPAPKIEVAR